MCEVVGFWRARCGGVTLEHPLPLGPQLLMAEWVLRVDCARGVFSDHEVEKLFYNFGSSPAERGKILLVGICSKTLLISRVLLH
jgi:hypothetical protein